MATALADFDPARPDAEITVDELRTDLRRRLDAGVRAAASHPLGTAQRGLGVDGWGNSLVVGAGSIHPRCPHIQPRCPHIQIAGLGNPTVRRS